MKMVKASKDILEKESKYRSTKIQKTLEEFMESGMDCVELQYEETEYVSPYSLTASIKNAIKRFGYAGTIKAGTRDKKVYMWRKDNANV